MSSAIAGLGRDRTWLALHMIDQLDDGAGRQNIDILAGPGGFGAAGLGADEAEIAAIGGHRRRQHAGHRGNRAIERQFAKHHIALHEIGRHDAHGGEHAKRDRQVVMAAFLGQVGGRQIDGQAPCR